MLPMAGIFYLNKKAVKTLVFQNKAVNLQKNYK